MPLSAGANPSVDDSLSVLLKASNDVMRRSMLVHGGMGSQTIQGDVHLLALSCSLRPLRRMLDLTYNHISATPAASQA